MTEYTAYEFSIPKCPTCGEPLWGSSDMVPACAVMREVAPGVYDFAGYTEMFWDGTHNEAPANQMLLQCRNGHQWLSSYQLVTWKEEEWKL